MEIQTSTSIAHHVFTFLFPFLLLIATTQTTSISAASTTTNTIYTNYIKTACNSTTNPSLCYQTLETYASTIKTNPKTLCTTALSITLNAAKNASSSLSNLQKTSGLTAIELAIIKDCVEEVDDGVDEIKQSLKEMKQLSSNDEEFQISNIKTWMSAALTDEDTCTDGFDDGKVRSTIKNQIRKIIVNLATLTSNTLALINNLNY